MEKNSGLTVVAAALVAEDGRVLLQRRAAGRAMAGLWEFPGGKVEPGERPEAALVRELGEELGIAVSPEALVPCAFASADNEGRHMLLLLFTCRTWRGTPAALDAEALAWIRLEEMRALAMPPADRPLVDLLERLISPVMPDLIRHPSSGEGREEPKLDPGSSPG
jgi:8-oxo-dGTP diphosphatase